MDTTTINESILDAISDSETHTDIEISETDESSSGVDKIVNFPDRPGDPNIHEISDESNDLVVAYRGSSSDESENVNSLTDSDSDSESYSIPRAESDKLEIVDESSSESITSKNDLEPLTQKINPDIVEIDGTSTERLSSAASIESINDLEESKHNMKRLSAVQNLVDDIKPIHTGKTGMQTFNNQQSRAVSLMKTLSSSLDSKPSENDFAEDPKGLKVNLMPHQKHALLWMLWREKQKPRGGILADDMGLGKTMSMISLVLHKRNANGNGEDSSDFSDDNEEESKENKSSWISKGSSTNSYYYGGTLVVCPASVMDQWKAEVKNRVNKNAISVVVHHGNVRETIPRRLSKNDMVITSYGIVKSEADNQGALFSIKWERIILDEAHTIRNHTSKQSIACCQLKGSARWALTGTPIQNKELDLYALLKFLKCRPFDDYTSFKMWISKTSTKSQERLNHVLQSLLLRRTKDDLRKIDGIESLPEKKIEIVSINLNTEEMNVYQKVMIYSQHLFAQFLQQRENRNNFAVNTTQTTDQQQQWAKLHRQITKIHGSTDMTVSGHQILILILRLRQICIHPSLIDNLLTDGDLDPHSDSDNVSEVDLLDQLNNLKIKDDDDEVDDTASKASSKVLLRTNTVFRVDRISSKFRTILQWIREKVIAVGEKGIVVSQFANVLCLFGNFLTINGIKFVSLTGATKISLRNDMVTNFNSSNSSSQIMLLSLTAGGVGLNLIGANHLFFVDPHWNPQLESQAQDRIYRMGQKKPVTIYKFLCEDTIERRIQHLQNKKLEMADQILTGANRTSSKLTIQDMKTLFEL